jgi:rhomboid protease GluP
VAAPLLIALCVAAYVAEHLYPSSVTVWLSRWRTLGAGQAFSSSTFWQLVLLATISHEGVLHLAVNIWCLLVFAPPFERRFAKLALVACWVIAGTVSMGVELAIRGDASIGISGFTYALLGVALTDMGRLRASPQQFQTALVMLGLVAFGGAEMIGIAHVETGISHLSHIAGLLLGLVFGLIVRRRPQPAR